MRTGGNASSFLLLGGKIMENPEKMAGLQDFITNACNQDAGTKVRLVDLYKSYNLFTKEISMQPYSRTTFREHINHLFKIKKDPETNTMIVSGIKPKDEQQKEFKLDPDEVAKASIEEAKADMVVEQADIKLSPDEEWAEKMKTHLEGIKKEDLIVTVHPETVSVEYKPKQEEIKTSNTKDYINSLKEQRKLIDKKISVMYKLDALKEITDKLFSGTMTNMAMMNDSKSIDAVSSKISEAIKIISDVKI
jgi:hypothetical protein